MLAVHLPIEWPTAVAHPANDLRRHAGDERVRRDIFRNNRTGGDHRQCGGSRRRKASSRSGRGPSAAAKVGA